MPIKLLKNTISNLYQHLSALSFHEKCLYGVSLGFYSYTIHYSIQHYPPKPWILLVNQPRTSHQPLPDPQDQVTKEPYQLLSNHRR